MLTIKVMVIGDCNIGKTSLIQRYTQNEFSKAYNMTTFTNISRNMKIDGKIIQLNISDTTGYSDIDYDRTRISMYSETDIFLLCFSLVNPASFDNILTKFYPEVRRQNPKTPILLVGTQHDLRSDKETLQKMKEKQLLPIECSQGLALASKIGAVKYIECSAAISSGVKTVFEDAIRVVMYSLPQSERMHRAI